MEQYYYMILLVFSFITTVVAKNYINENKDKMIYYSLFSILLAITALISFLDKKLIPILEAMK